MSSTTLQEISDIAKANKNTPAVTEQALIKATADIKLDTGWGIRIADGPISEVIYEFTSKGFIFKMVYTVDHAGEIDINLRSYLQRRHNDPVPHWVSHRLVDILGPNEPVGDCGFARLYEIARERCVHMIAEFYVQTGIEHYGALALATSIVGPRDGEHCMLLKFVSSPDEPVEKGLATAMVDHVVHAGISNVKRSDGADPFCTRLNRQMVSLDGPYSLI